MNERGRSDVGRSEDRNPLDSTQRQEIGGGAHDIIRPPGDCTLEKPLGARIAAEAERDGRLNELGPPAEEPQERAGSDWTDAELFKRLGTSQEVDLD